MTVSRKIWQWENEHAKTNHSMNRNVPGWTEGDLNTQFIVPYYAQCFLKLMDEEDTFSMDIPDLPWGTWANIPSPSQPWISRPREGFGKSSHVSRIWFSTCEEKYLPKSWFFSEWIYLRNIEISQNACTFLEYFLESMPSRSTSFFPMNTLNMVWWSSRPDLADAGL